MSRAGDYSPPLAASLEAVEGPLAKLEEFIRSSKRNQILCSAIFHENYAGSLDKFFVGQLLAAGVQLNDHECKTLRECTKAAADRKAYISEIYRELSARLASHYAIQLDGIEEPARPSSRSLHSRAISYVPEAFPAANGDDKAKQRLEQPTTSLGQKKWKSAFLKLKVQNAFRKRGTLSSIQAANLRNAAVRFEPTFTELLQGVAKDFGGELVGLEARFKSTKSLEEKLTRAVHAANLKLLEVIERRQDSGACASALKEHRQAHRSMRKLLSPRVQRSPSSSDGARAVGLWSRLRLNVQSSARANRAVNAFQAFQADKTASPGKEEAQALSPVETQAMEREAACARAVESAMDAAVTEAEAAAAVDIGQVVWKVSDALRYTVVLDTDKFSEAVATAVKRLRDQGMQEASLKNYWGEGNGYKGINDVFGVPCAESVTGLFKVEVQFHTRESFELKSLAHGLYEEYRSTVDPDRKQQLWEAMVEKANGLPVPPGATLIPKLTVKKPELDTMLYAELLIARALSIKSAAVALVEKACSELVLRGGAHGEGGEGAGLVEAKVLSHVIAPKSADLRMRAELAHYQEKQQAAAGGRGSPGLSIDSGGDDGQAGGASTSALQHAFNKVRRALTVMVVLPAEQYASAANLLRERLRAGGQQAAATQGSLPASPSRAAGKDGDALPSPPARPAKAEKAAPPLTPAPPPAPRRQSGGAPAFDDLPEKLLSEKVGFSSPGSSSSSSSSSSAAAAAPLSSSRSSKVNPGAAGGLEAAALGFTEERASNEWLHPAALGVHGPRGGVGLRLVVTLPGEDDGVDFTEDDAYPVVVDIHTEESRRTALGLQAAWSELRSATTAHERRAIHARARRLVANTPVPPGARFAFRHHGGGSLVGLNGGLGPGLGPGLNPLDEGKGEESEGGSSSEESAYEEDLIDMGNGFKGGDWMLSPGALASQKPAVFPENRKVFKKGSS